MLATEAVGHELKHRAGWSESGNSSVGLPNYVAAGLLQALHEMLMQIIVTGCSRVLSLVCFIRYRR